MDNEKEVETLQEQAKRLQVQLNNGYTAFADFKKKKAEEITALEVKLEEAKSVIDLNPLAAQSSFNQVKWILISISRVVWFPVISSPDFDSIICLSF